MGTFEDAQGYIAHTGVTFALLWTDTWDVWDHYGMRSTSDFILLDPSGNRVTGSAQPYDEARITTLVEDLF